jgi:hypothetical protein
MGFVCRGSTALVTSLAEDRSSKAGQGRACKLNFELVVSAPETVLARLGSKGLNRFVTVISQVERASRVELL